MSLTRTPEGKVVVVEIATGHRFERWPVDAREMLATGDYTTEQPPAATADTVPVTLPLATAPEAADPSVVAPLPEGLADMTKAELAVFAQQTFGLALDVTQNKPTLLALVTETHASHVALAAAVQS